MQTVHTNELHTILESELSQHFGAPRKITQLVRRPSEYRTSFAIEELAITLDDGRHLALIFKNLSWQALSHEVRQVKPQFLHNPLREIEVYRTILAPHQIGTATCYGAFVDAQQQWYWLFLEKVPGLELYQIGAFEQWQAVARWLAEFHSRFAAPLDQLKDLTSLLCYDGAFYRRWLERACAFADCNSMARLRDTQKTLTWVAERYEKVVERLVALPPTFIHGEFYASNILIRDESEGLHVCPVDWEMAGVGPGLVDLAALVSGKWSAEQKALLAMSYYEAQKSTACKHMSPGEFLTALDCCRLHIAIQWLGWAPNWSPPAENTHDWLGEALHLVQRLAL